VKQSIDDIVVAGIAGAELVTNAGAEITYRLPFEQTEAFPAVFGRLDEAQHSLQINSYGVSITTLEEVFLKIGLDAEREYEAERRRKAQGSTARASSLAADDEKYVDLPDEDPQRAPFPQPTFQLEEMSAVAIFFRHVAAILYQRVILSYRDIRSLCCQMLCPLLFTLLGMWLLTLITAADVQPPLLMTVAQWHSAETYQMMVARSGLADDAGYNASNWPAAQRSELKAAWQHSMTDVAGNWADLTFAESDAAGAEAQNARSFGDELLEHKNPADGVMHYNALYLPSFLPSAAESTSTTGPPGGNETATSAPTAHPTPNPAAVFCDDMDSDAMDWAEAEGYDICAICGFRCESSSTATPRVYLVVNASAFHALPITFNAFNNFMLRRTVASAMESDSDFSPLIQLTSWPLPTTVTEAAFDDQTAGFMVSLFLTIGLGFLPLGAIYQIVNDRTMATKHQQLVSGVSCAAYWTGNYIADFVITLPTVLAMFVLIHAFDAKTFLAEHQGPFVLVLVMYSLAILPFTYLVSFLFRSADKAQVVVATLYFLMGIVLLVVSYVVRFAVAPDALSDAGKNRLEDLLYRVFPTFSMADSFLDMAYRYALPEVDEWAYTDTFFWDLLSYDVGKNLTTMAVEAVLYFAMVIGLEYALLHKTVIDKWWSSSNETVQQKVAAVRYDDCDSDVAAEVERVRGLELEAASDGDGDKVVIKGLHKLYRPDLLSPCTRRADKRTVHAVRGVHLGVARGEVFGYLGVNGAGKTTTLACLTGERSMTAGEAFINGISVDHQTATRRFVGYCPQFDALFPLLTGREHLSFYGRIKGLYGAELRKQVAMLLEVLSLTKYQDRRAGTYSGGNRRKLSVAVAMIGNPPIVFLDEPSTGMDPMARRSMWDFIRQTMRGRCVILTTHSMEECEALCHRLCIMTHGQLRCLGTPQHLKSKFGHGFQLDLDIEKDGLSGDGNRAVIEKALRTVFEMDLIDQAQCKVAYEVSPKTKDAMTLGQMFGAMERFKKELPIVSYALNQTTLEQVFIRMAGENKTDDE